jgi:hypothetical protein
MIVLSSWAVLVSQTGSEVIAISEKLGILPSLLVTNRVTKISEKKKDSFRTLKVRFITDIQL